MEKKSFTFRTDGPNLKEIMDIIGIEHTTKDGKNFISYGDVVIPRPPHDKFEEIVLQHFGIVISYTD